MNSSMGGFVTTTILGYLVSVSLAFFAEEPIKSMLSDFVTKPSDVVEDYYANIKNKNIGSAYELWDGKPASFKNDIQKTANIWKYHDLFVDKQKTKSSGDFAVVYITLDITTIDGKEKYSGPIILKRDAFDWKLSEILLK